MCLPKGKRVRISDFTMFSLNCRVVLFRQNNVSRYSLTLDHFTIQSSLTQLSFSMVALNAARIVQQLIIAKMKEGKMTMNNKLTTQLRQQSTNNFAIKLP